MSTKIYNGYILPKEYLDIDKLLSFCKKLRREIWEQKTEVHYQNIARTLAIIIDNALLNIKTDLIAEEEDKICDFFSAAALYVRDRIKSRKKYERDPQYDYSFEVVFFPLPEKVLCLTYCENEDLRRVWDAQVQEYHYQDQTDPPEDMPEKAWEQRKIDWNTVLGGDGWGIPIEHGLSFTFSSKDLGFDLSYGINREKVLELLPSFEDRVKRAASDIFVKNFVSEKSSMTEDAAKTEKNSNLFVHTYNALSLVQNNAPEYLEVLESVREKLLPYKEITLDLISSHVLPQTDKTQT